MKTLAGIIIGISVLLNLGLAGELSYKLNLTNLIYTSENSLEFDIYLINTSSDKGDIRYSLGQYFLTFNPGISNTGTLTYSIVRSDLPESMRPVNPSVFENQLRMAVNNISFNAEQFPVIPKQEPGLLIAGMRLETSAGKFSEETPDVRWSEQGFITKIVAFIDNKMLEITDNENHFIEADNSFNGQFHDKSIPPGKFSLSQNFPNPFNPSTLISYSIIENAFTSLKIYDTQGKEVATLVNENQAPGKYEVTFNGSKFSSGVYFYKIKSGKITVIKKMFLVK